MHYLFASESLGRQSRLFAEIAKTLGGDAELQTYRSAEQFLARLHRHNRPEIMILLASDPRDLERLSLDREVLFDADVILLVSDGAESTVATAHSLRPNYLGNADCDLEQIVPVLERLLQKRARQSERGKAAGS
jgi:hypothetical protein